MHGDGGGVAERHFLDGEGGHLLDDGVLDLAQDEVGGGGVAEVPLEHGLEEIHARAGDHGGGGGLSDGKGRWRKGEGERRRV